MEQKGEQEGPEGLDKQETHESSEAPVTASYPGQFNLQEEHHIEMMAEAIRRSRSTADAPTFRVEEDVKTQSFEQEIVVLYPARRRHIFWFLNEARRRIGYGILTIVFAWVLVFLLPSILFTQEIADTHTTIEVLIGIGATMLVVLMVYLFELRKFVLWRTWKLEVTNTTISVGQPGNGFLGIDEDQTVFKRSGGEIADATRKWYFKLLTSNIYTVSFDSTAQMDEKFKDLTFIKDGNTLKNIFS